MRPRLASLARRLTSSASPTYDVAVVGGGVMGAFTALAAARRGASVALLDQFSAGHPHGSSHGDGRIYRLAYTQDHYVDMMLHALPLWQQLEAEIGRPLMARTGGLSIARAASGSLDELGALYARRGFDHEWMSAGAVNARFPQFGLQEGEHEALFLGDFGVLFASRCVEAAWERAAALGADVRSPFRLAALRDDGDSATVVEAEDGQAVRARAVVLALGAWLTPTAARLFGLQIPTKVTSEVVSYYAPKAGCEIDHTHRSMPCFLPSELDFPNEVGTQGYYGLPMIGTADGIPGVKCSAHYSGPMVHPDARPETAGGSAANWRGGGAAAPPLLATTGAGDAAARVEAIVASTTRYVAATFPHLETTPVATQQCMYTTTPDFDYVLGRVPSAPRVVLAGGGSGHAFKMGPAIGDCAAALALGKPPPLPVERFAVDREYVAARSAR